MVNFATLRGWYIPASGPQDQTVNTRKWESVAKSRLFDLAPFDVWHLTASFHTWCPKVLVDQNYKVDHRAHVFKARKMLLRTQRAPLMVYWSVLWHLTTWTARRISLRRSRASRRPRPRGQLGIRAMLQILRWGKEDGGRASGGPEVSRTRSPQGLSKTWTNI